LAAGDIGEGMTARSQPPKDPAKAEREKRLAEALRANLRRRKEAARGQKAPEPGGNTEKSGETGDDTTGR